MPPIDNDTLETMIRAPSEHFETPVAVTADDRLSHAQKEAVLRAWAAACREHETAAGETVPAGLDRSYLKEIERAIDLLAELRRP
ncbi:MAG: hypothetical protein ACU85V_04460 [Gammaproteobacteria bacterium]